MNPNDPVLHQEQFNIRPRESELLSQKVVSVFDWKRRFCKHKKWPCRECGTKHYENCECGFCR